MSIQEIQENDYIKDSRDVINNNFAELDEGKLSLSGGTMTGDISYVNGDNEAFNFGFSDANKDNVDIGWLWNDKRGAGIGLRNVSHSEAGAFNIWATDGTNTVILFGKPDGTLNWNNKSIVVGENNAGFHNSIFRGKNLGNALTSAQSSAIQGGTFNDMFVGDYWTINDITWRIAGFDYWYRVGDTSFNTHHAVIVPDTYLYTAQYNSTNTTEGGYVGSALYSGIGTAQTTVRNAFGTAHVPKHRILLPTTCTGGKYTGWAWQDEDVILMNEVMVYGARAWGDSGNNGRSVGSQNTQLPLFALNPASVHTRQSYWLMDVSSASSFALVSYLGLSSNHNASTSIGVRPAFALI